MSRRTLLVVEDDSAIRRGVVDALRFAGFDVREAGHGDVGRDMAVTEAYDLLLLDLALPGCSGLDILRAVRTSRPSQPVIVLTARGDEHDRVAGLKAGADDYVVKPFSVRELLARVEAVLRRSPGRPLDVTVVPFLTGTIDFDRCEIRFADGERSPLSERELELVRYLAINPDRAVPRDELLANVWRINPDGLTTRTVDMHIARLREKLRDDSTEPRILLTVRGKGYMFARQEVH